MASDTIFQYVPVSLTSLPTLIGDSGTGGVPGLVPAPHAGDTVAGKFLMANGTWAIPFLSGFQMDGGVF